jgi:membrane-associated phospholipid phosphatase
MHSLFLQNGQVLIWSAVQTFALGITHLGNAVLLLCAAVVLALWWAAGGAGRLALRWLLVLGAAVAVVLATKLAFLGWGVGVASLDFTGLSGHATLSAAVLPVLAWAMGSRASHKLRCLAVAGAATLALAVGASRWVLQAHSVSEILLGWILGGAVAWAMLRGLARSHGEWPAQAGAVSPWWLAAGLAALLLWTAPRNGQGPETHGLVVQLALWASGRAEPYTRAMLHVD